MIQGIGLIGIAVKDIEQVLDQFCKSLALERPEVKEVPERRMKVAILKLGAVQLELLEETESGGILSGSVKERGDFIHHLCLITDNIDKDILKLESRGVKMAQDEPSTGLRGKRVSFAVSGILGDIPIELSEP